MQGPQCCIAHHSQHLLLHLWHALLSLLTMTSAPKVFLILLLPFHLDYHGLSEAPQRPSPGPLKQPLSCFLCFWFSVEIVDDFLSRKQIWSLHSPGNPLKSPHCESAQTLHPAAKALQKYPACSVGLLPIPSLCTQMLTTTRCAFSHYLCLRALSINQTPNIYHTSQQRSHNLLLHL